jgi:hypothetical protein
MQTANHLGTYERAQLGNAHLAMNTMHVCTFLQWSVQAGTSRWVEPQSIVLEIYHAVTESEQLTK